MEELTAELLRDTVGYDPLTGAFWRLASGAKAGGKVGGGYIELRVNGHRVYGHRAAWLMVRDADDEDVRQKNFEVLQMDADRRLTLSV